MKYYSEKLDEMFDTEDQLLKAEELADKNKVEEKTLKENCETAIKLAEELVKEAEIEMEDATNQVAQLQEEYDAKVDAIMEPARKKLEQCIAQRNNCIKNYNEKFGPYITIHTKHTNPTVDNGWSKVFESFFRDLGL